jgi:hypothetical protein
MCACSKLTKSGNVSFYSQSTSVVAQRALRESSEDSNGERENDALSKSLQAKENEVVFMVFVVSLPGRRIFHNTNLYIGSEK